MTVLNYINEVKDINGDSWYHQIVVDKLNEKIDKLESRISKAMKLLELSPNLRLNL